MTTTKTAKTTPRFQGRLSEAATDTLAELSAHLGITKVAVIELALRRFATLERINAAGEVLEREALAAFK